MVVRKAEIKDLQRIQELNNELFELELANFDKYFSEFNDQNFEIEDKKFEEELTNFLKNHLNIY